MTSLFMATTPVGTFLLQGCRCFMFGLRISARNVEPVKLDASASDIGPSHRPYARRNMKSVLVGMLNYDNTGATRSSEGNSQSAEHAFKNDLIPQLPDRTLVCRGPQAISKFFFMSRHRNCTKFFGPMHCLCVHSCALQAYNVSKQRVIMAIFASITYEDICLQRKSGEGLIERL